MVDAFVGLAVRVKPVSPLLGFAVWHPDLFGRAGQVGLANAHGAELVIVSMRLLEFAQLTTLQNQGSALDSRQAPHHLEAVAGSLQHDQVLGGGVLLGPTWQLAHRHFIEDFLHDGCRRSGPPDHGCREAVGVSVQTDHSLDRV